MFWVCRTCGVEHAEKSAVCPICADERQWVPREGQRWATLDELAGEGVRSNAVTLEDGLIGVGAAPAVGIGQIGKLVCCPDGNVLWDPPGFLDDAAVAEVARYGPI
ncbi:MAG TPA: hydrolase, partial [Mycobacterium sp.]